MADNVGTPDLPLPDEAVRAIKRAAETLEPYAGLHPQVAALFNKLMTIAHPEGATVAKAHRELETIMKASTEGLSAGDRTSIAKATNDAQLAYLREMSPAAAEAWERAHRHAAEVRSRW